MWGMWGERTLAGGGGGGAGRNLEVGLDLTARRADTLTLRGAHRVASGKPCSLREASGVAESWAARPGCQGQGHSEGPQWPRRPHCARLFWESWFKADPGLGCPGHPELPDGPTQPGRASASPGSAPRTPSLPHLCPGDSPLVPTWGAGGVLSSCCWRWSWDGRLASAQVGPKADSFWSLGLEPKVISPLSE